MASFLGVYSNEELPWEAIAWEANPWATFPRRLLPWPALWGGYSINITGHTNLCRGSLNAVDCLSKSPRFALALP